MEVILVSNNLIENNLLYNENKIDKKKLKIPLFSKNKDYAQRLSLLTMFNNTGAIYSSTSASARIFAQYLAKRLKKDVYLDDKLDAPIVGDIKNKDLKNIYFMQEHDFNIKLEKGESLNETCKRFTDSINHIVYLNKANKVVVFTHLRTILSYLINHTKVGYNLEDELILEYNDDVVYSGDINDISIYKLNFEDRNLVNIKKIIL